MIALVKLLESVTDFGGYVTYVFEFLDKMPDKYIMCTKCPNWDSKVLKKGDIGYLHYEERIAGRDKWFDGVNMVPYLYNWIQFMKFIPKTEDNNEEYII